MHSYVTGATGFIGLALVKALLARGDTVTVLRRPTSDTRWLEGLPVRHVLGDVTDPASLQGTMRGVDRVFHVAGAIAYRRVERARGWQVNVVGTQHVLNEAIAAGVGRFVYTSSIAAVGVPSDPDHPADETFPFNGDAYDLQYFISKHEGERRVLAAARRGFPAVVVNPATVYGPGDRNFNGGRLLKLAVAGGLRRYPPGGMCVCDIDDVVAGHIAAAERGRIGERYILGGENLPFRDILALANRVVGRSHRLWPLPRPVLRLARPFVVALERLPLRDLYLARDYLVLADKFLYFSSEKAVRELGYRMTPFKLSLERAYAWYREQGLL